MINFSNSYNKFVLGLEQINSAAAEYPSQFVEDIEKMYRKEVCDVVNYVLNRCDRCKVLLLAGPSSSGKTTTAHLIKQELINRGAQAIIISLDDFYLGGNKAPLNEDGTPNYEAIEALDIDLVKECLKNLKNNGVADIPQFDFKVRSRKIDTNHIELSNNGIAIIEGIHALNPMFINHIKGGLVKLYISVKQGIKDYNGEILSRIDIRLLRRIVRDYHNRNTNPEDTFSMWASVRKGESLYIDPFKRTSDVTINSLHLYELCVLCHTAVPLLLSIKEGSVYYKLSRKLLSGVERFYPITEDLVPKNSLIREFIGGGIY